MGCVGKDEYSKILESKARSDGVDVRYQYTDKESTGWLKMAFDKKKRNK